MSNNLAEIPKRGRKELKSIVIDNKKFRYNKDKPISNVLTKKLLTVKKTNEYRSYALNKAKDAFSEGTVKHLLTNNSYADPFSKYEFQIDLMDVTSLLRDVGSEIKSQLRYGLVCIDIFSKKCHIVPIENKDGDDVYKAVVECFKVLGQPLSIYSDDEGALNSKKLQTCLKEEGITHVITKTHANQAERMIRTVKKMIGDRLRHHKTKTWVEVLKPSLNRYNNQIHRSTKTTPNNAHNLDNVIQVRTNLILKEKHNRKYPNISEGDYVKIFDKGKGNYVSRKETRSEWSERKYKVILVVGIWWIIDIKNWIKLDGISKRYNRHELLLVD